MLQVTYYRFNHEPRVKMISALIHTSAASSHVPEASFWSDPSEKMSNTLLVYLLVIVSVCLRLSLGVSWTQLNFPNPNISPRACGRLVDKSWVCDPDEILSTESKNVIEGVIKKIEQGDEPYARAPCGTLGNIGFQVSYWWGPCRFCHLD